MNFLELLNSGNIVGAHRGARSLAPENTMRALKKSVGRSDFIEIDVQLSCDGEAVIIHDETLERTTNLTKPQRVSALSLEELSKLDYGSWFDGKSEPLLTLNNALKFIKENNLFLNIEIKDMHEYFSDDQVVITVVQSIKSHKLESQVLISSFRGEYLSMCKEVSSYIPTALLVDNKHPDNLIEYLKELKVDAYHMNDELVDSESIAQLRKEGFYVNVYTVSNLLRQKELFKMGVNGVFSDILK